MSENKTLEGALFEACKVGNDDQVSLLLGLEGTDVNVKDGMSWTPLPVASREGHTGVVALLLENGADFRSYSHLH